MTDRRYSVSTRLHPDDESAHWRTGADDADLDGAIAVIAGRCEGGEIVVVAEFDADGRLCGRFSVDADGRRVGL
jgi:hypothetical protein